MTRTPRGLIPDFALTRMPQAIQDGQAAVAPIAEGLAAARVRVAEARVAADQAPEVDGEALAAAARAGNKPPTPTQPKREHELRAAKEAVKVLSSDHDEAIRKFHRVVADHAREAVDAQAEAVTEKKVLADSLLEQFIEALQDLDAENGVLVALAGANESKESSVRGKRYARLGRLDFEGKRAVPSGLSLAALIPTLRAAVEARGAEVTETAGERQEREEREHAEKPRMPRSMAGGIYVG
jgi:hypothetical protein